MTAVIIALVVGVFTGAIVVWMVTRGLGQAAPGVMQSQGEIKPKFPLSNGFGGSQYACAARDAPG